MATTRHRKRQQRSTRSFRQRNIYGGGPTPMPMHFYTDAYDPQLTNDPTGSPSAPVPPSLVRPALNAQFVQNAGRQRQRTQRQRSRKQRAGFTPSIMGPFVKNAMGVAVPLAAVAASQYFGTPKYAFGKAKSFPKTKKFNKRH